MSSPTKISKGSERNIPSIPFVAGKSAIFSPFTLQLQNYSTYNLRLRGTWQVSHGPDLSFLLASAFKTKHLSQRFHVWSKLCKSSYRKTSTATIVTEIHRFFFFFFKVLREIHFSHRSNHQRPCLCRGQSNQWVNVTLKGRLAWLIFILENFISQFLVPLSIYKKNHINFLHVSICVFHWEETYYSQFTFSWKFSSFFARGKKGNKTVWSIQTKELLEICICPVPDLCSVLKA